jgi:hypothetical protein
MYTTSDKFHSFGESDWTTVFDSNNPCSKAKSTPKSTPKPKTAGKKKSNKSHSSTDRSIANDSDESENESVEDEPIDVKSKNDFAAGKCLISIKK